MDTLWGGAGADWMAGGSGLDILFGGEGADRFAFAKGSGTDWIADFNPAEGDRIVLAGAAYTVIDWSGQVMIILGDGDRLGLAGVAFASFDPSWIV